MTAEDVVLSLSAAQLITRLTRELPPLGLGLGLGQLLNHREVEMELLLLRMR